MKNLFIAYIVCFYLLQMTLVSGCNDILKNKLKRRLPMAVIVQNCDDSKIEVVDDAVVSQRSADLENEIENPDDETLREALKELEDDDDEEFEESEHEPKSIYRIVSAVLKRLHHVARRAVKRARTAEKRERLLREAYVRRSMADL